MWANFGVANVSELTTLSLHTSLASKMQSYAKPNGIVAGQYIKDRLQEGDAFFQVVEEKRYIFENDKKGFRYTQYIFDWYSFLKSLPFIGTDSQGNLYFIKPGIPFVLPTAKPQHDLEALGAIVGGTKPYNL